MICEIPFQFQSNQRHKKLSYSSEKGGFRGLVTKITKTFFLSDSIWAQLLLLVIPNDVGVAHSIDETKI